MGEMDGLAPLNDIFESAVKTIRARVGIYRNFNCHGTLFGRPLGSVSADFLISLDISGIILKGEFAVLE